MKGLASIPSWHPGGPPADPASLFLPLTSAGALRPSLGILPFSEPLLKPLIHPMNYQCISNKLLLFGSNLPKLLFLVAKNPD